MYPLPFLDLMTRRERCELACWSGFGAPPKLGWRLDVFLIESEKAYRQVRGHGGRDDVGIAVLESCLGRCSVWIFRIGCVLWRGAVGPEASTRLVFAVVVWLFRLANRWYRGMPDGKVWVQRHFFCFGCQSFDSCFDPPFLDVFLSSELRWYSIYADNATA